MFGLKLVKEEYLKDLKNSVIKQESRCEDLTNRNNHSASRNISLKATNATLERKIKNVQAAWVAAKNKNDILRSDVDGLEAKLIASQNDLAELSKEYSNLNEQKVNLEKEVKTKEVIIENYTDKMSTDRACIIELENKLAKLQEKYDFEHIENKMKIKGFDRGQYYQVLGFTDKANAFVRLRHSNLKSLRGKILNFDQLKHEILTRGLDVSYFYIVRVDVKI